MEGANGLNALGFRSCHFREQHGRAERHSAGQQWHQHSAAGASSTAPATVTIQNTLVAANSMSASVRPAIQILLSQIRLSSITWSGCRRKTRPPFSAFSQSTVTGNATGWPSASAVVTRRPTPSAATPQEILHRRPARLPLPTPTHAPVATDIPPASEADGLIAAQRRHRLSS
jgi:hypothetical protein